MSARGWIYDSERDVRDAALLLECRIYGYAPVQADGRLAGHPFYFRARWDHWDFVLCTNADIDPSCLGQGDEPGPFREGEFEGFALWGDFGSDAEASSMPYAVAERLIRECASRYLVSGGPA